ncbi:MAG: branched-chain amino acid ABC transporter permease, partial [Candidatus Eremiobacteraeota bacterium]|nr:branched-chain amino acid ABC transporter permease [Candidatus Eremiobacteraeota bacterium]
MSAAVHGVKRRSLAPYGIGAFIVVGAILPFFVRDPYFQQVIVDGYITAIAVYGLNIILGYAGQLSLAHAAFFGIGAYTVALLTTKTPTPFWPALLGACALTGICGFLVALIALRTRGNYFAIFTSAIGVMINIVFTTNQALTNGNIGIVGIPSPPPIGPIDFNDPIAKYELIFVGLLIAIWVCASIRNSLFGRSLLALSGNEDLARAVGSDVMGHKRTAFVISTILAGFAGGFYAMFVGVLGPESTGLDVTFNMLLYAIVGGLGSIAGPLIGTLLLATLSQFLQSFEKYQLLVYG